MNSIPIRLNELESQASKKGILLRIQIRRPLGLWSLRLVAAKQFGQERIQILGEMKAWAYAKERGLQLDNLRISKDAPKGLNYLIWSATMLWALEKTPCRYARLLAINDNDYKHIVLIKYFQRKGFKIIKEVKAEAKDLPYRIVWGGAGTLMSANCHDVLSLNYNSWQAIRKS